MTNSPENQYRHFVRPLRDVLHFSIAFNKLLVFNLNLFKCLSKIKSLSNGYDTFTNIIVLRWLILQTIPTISDISRMYGNNFH
jgi:hypothetical protein